ncbi:hypothetical protein [Engelhardtia mirabilis]|uniref:FG-GAP repeat protein n=1 Tax=Engelhardtia mirabilis TaxID=2528011 RepID=A0A518BR86_9BACT|nr:hypothetical protein Pla133_46040 [Planctomycetes bacterium Pla133]QDV03810.1 hypothetical protein Pla86_46020 [Planctomycetes bacterium Pla86]
MKNPIRPSSSTLLFTCIALQAGAAATPAVQGSEDHKLLAAAVLAGDEFGSSVGTDGVRVAVGAPLADAAGPDAGSAFLFDATTGGESVQLVPTGVSAGDRFGAAVCVDGALALVGAPFADVTGTDSGAAYLFDASSGTQSAELQPSDAAVQFGTAVAMDGGLAVVGALGAAYVFDVATGQELAKLAPSGTGSAGGFGGAVDIDAGLVVVGAQVGDGLGLLTGTAFVFDAASGVQIRQLSALDGTAWSFFGSSVAIDAGTVVVGARTASPKGKDSGAAYMFDAVTGQQIEKLVPNDGHIFAEFGSSVGIEGPLVVVGAGQDNQGGFSSGAVYVYQAASGSFVTKLLASDSTSSDELGGAVCVAGGVIVAGAARDDDVGDACGSAYLFGAAGVAAPMSECLGNLGSLDLAAGLPFAGQTLTLRTDGAQPATLASLLVVSAAPVAGWPSCGVDFGTAGELLVDLAPSSELFASIVPWTGAPADFSISVPSVAGLAGLQIYAQGALLAPLSPTETVRLTHGLEITLGGYL